MREVLEGGGRSAGRGRVLVTGSSDGIGAEVARTLQRRGWQVVRHARSAARAEDVRSAHPGAEVVVGDLASLASTRAMAEELLAGEPLQVVVHNAGWSAPEGPRPVTPDGLEQTFQVNTVAPYLLSALLPLPERVVVVGSDSIRGAHLDLADLQLEHGWEPGRAYAASKVAVTTLALALARRYPATVCNAVHPGWVRTKMAGDEAPLDVAAGADTVVWLAEGEDAVAQVSGRLLRDRRPVTYNEQVTDTALQDALVAELARLTGAPLRGTAS